MSTSVVRLTGSVIPYAYVPDDLLREGTVEISLPDFLFSTGTEVYNFPSQNLMTPVSTIKLMFVDCSNVPLASSVVIQLPQFHMVFPGGISGYIPVFVNMPFNMQVSLTGFTSSCKARIVLFNFEL